jgi:hypothetical protein
MAGYDAIFHSPSLLCFLARDDTAARSYRDRILLATRARVRAQLKAIFRRS